MPDQISFDEFDALRGLEVARPIASAEIRRRGERRRRTRGALGASAAAAVVAALVAGSVWAGGRAGSPVPAPVVPATSPTSSPTSVPFSPALLLASEEVASEALAPGMELSPWKPRDTVPTLDCQPAADALADLGADDSVAQTLGIRVLGVGAEADFGRFSQAVLRFPDAASAQQALGTVGGWLANCAAPYGGQRVFSDGDTLDLRSLPGRSVSHAWSYSAPELCEACDVGWFTHQVATAVDGQLIVWSVRVSGGPMPPAGLDETAMTIAGAAVAKATSSTPDTASDPAPDPGDGEESAGGIVTAVPAGFPLLAGLPRRAATDDFGPYGPSSEGDLLTVPTCEEDLATPEPVAALLGGWRDPAEPRPASA